MVDFICKSLISCQVMILYLHFIVRITSYVQTLILELALSENFTSKFQTPPFIMQ